VRQSAIALLIMMAASPAAAEVKDAGDNGFTVAASATVAASPAQLWDALVHPARWWDMEHSYSHDAANLTLDPRAGGCFCERVPADGGEVEHGRVVQIRPGSLLRIDGAFGPFQEMAVSGVLSWTVRPAGMGATIGMTYTVGGYLPGGGKAFAPVVDAVMGGQFARLKALVDHQYPSPVPSN